MTTKPRARNTKNPQPKRAIDDNYVAPKARPRDKSKDVTLAEALAEADQTLEDLIVPNQEAAPTRPAGTSNLASTIRAHRSQYKTTESPTGKKTQNNGDQVAQALLRISRSDVAEFVATKQPGLSYAHLNPGHQRMCMGNKIRAWVKQGDQTTLLWLETAQSMPNVAEYVQDLTGEPGRAGGAPEDIREAPKKRQRKTKN